MVDTGQGRQEEDSQMMKSKNKMQTAQPVWGCFIPLSCLMRTLAQIYIRKVAGCFTFRASEVRVFLWTTWGLTEMLARQQHSATHHYCWLRLCHWNDSWKWVPVSLITAQTHVLSRCLPWSCMLPEACSFFLTGLRSRNAESAEAPFIPSIFYNAEKT